MLETSRSESFCTRSSLSPSEKHISQCARHCCSRSGKLDLTCWLTLRRTSRVLPLLNRGKQARPFRNNNPLGATILYMFFADDGKKLIPTLNVLTKAYGILVGDSGQALLEPAQTLSSRIYQHGPQDRCGQSMRFRRDIPTERLISALR